jgi:cell division control protein 6
MGDGEAKITEEHVRDAEHQIQRQQVVEGMHSLTRQGQYVLLTVCQLAAEGETP